MNFASDNARRRRAADSRRHRGGEPAAPAPAYGAGSLVSARAVARLAEVFETDLAAFLVPTGTGANALALSALARPWEAVFCHEEAHVHDDECGAPEFFTGGAKLVGIPGLRRQDHAGALAETLEPLSARARQVVPAGRVDALAGHRGRHGLFARRDSPRSPQSPTRRGSPSTWTARASPTRSSRRRVAPAEMTWRAGVDALSFGATKNGALACEAVVFFDPSRAATFAYQRKRGGHTLSKGRCSARRWRPISTAASGSISRAAPTPPPRGSVEGLPSAPGVRAAWPTEANEVFVVAPTARVSAWRAAGARISDWPTRALARDRAPGPGETLLRLVTSFETSDAEIDALITIARRA